MLRHLRTTVQTLSLRLLERWEHETSLVWQLPSIQETVRLWKTDVHDTSLGHIACAAGDIEMTIGRLDVAEPFLRLYHECAESHLVANPESAQAAWDVSVSLEKLADFLASRGLPGDADQALGRYQRSLAVRERLLLANPESAQASGKRCASSITKIDGLPTGNAEPQEAAATEAQPEAEEATGGDEKQGELPETATEASTEKSKESKKLSPGDVAINAIVEKAKALAKPLTGKVS